MSLRAGANHPTHLPFIKRPPKPLLLGYQGGDADDETTRRRGALDIATHFIRVAFRRVVPVQRQRVNTLPRAGACSGDPLNTPAGFTELPPPPRVDKTPERVDKTPDEKSLQARSPHR